MQFGGTCSDLTKKHYLKKTFKNCLLTYIILHYFPLFRELWNVLIGVHNSQFLKVKCNDILSFSGNLYFEVGLLEDRVRFGFRKFRVKIAKRTKILLNFFTSQWARKFKKVQTKKLVKSNKSIPFVAISKTATNKFFTWKNCQKCNFT